MWISLWIKLGITGDKCLLPVDNWRIKYVMSRGTLTKWIGSEKHIHISTENTPRLLFALPAEIRYTSEAQNLSLRELFTRNSAIVERKKSNLCAIIRLRGNIHHNAGHKVKTSVEKLLPQNIE